MTRPYFKRRPDEQTPLWAIHGEEPPISYRIEQQATPHDANGQAGFGEDVWKGVESFGRGIGRAATHVFETMGASNEQNHQKARHVDRIFWSGLKQAVSHPSDAIEGIIHAVPSGVDYVRSHPGKVAGRILAGTAAKQLPYIGVPSVIAAAYGDTMHAIQNGAETYDDVLRAILGGESPGQP